MSVHLTLQCDNPNCSAVAPDAVTGQGTAAEADELRRMLAALGWIRIHLRSYGSCCDLCPQCAWALRVVAGRRRRAQQRPARKAGEPVPSTLIAVHPEPTEDSDRCASP